MLAPQQIPGHSVTISAAGSSSWPHLGHIGTLIVQEEEQRDQAAEDVLLHLFPVGLPYKLQQVFKEGDGEHPEFAGLLQERMWGGDAVTVVPTQLGERSL